MSKVQEMDFSTIPQAKQTGITTIKRLLLDDKVGLFISINILLYGVMVLLGIFRLFGLL